MKKTLLLFLYLICTNLLFAQIDERQANTGDNIILRLPATVRGTIQWQSSPDNITYTNMAGKNESTLQLTATQTAYYRAMVTEGTCEPLYSDVTKVTVSGGAIVYGSVTDIEGNTYKTVVIGTQTWMAENLKTTKYNDGTAIPNVTDDNTWAYLTTPAYCWHNNETSFKELFGALYNQYVISTGNVCPSGWHVPSAGEWTKLENYLSENPSSTSVAIGTKLKSTNGWREAGNGSNESGFNALPSSERGISFYQGNRYSDFSSLTDYDVYFWTSTYSDNIANFIRLRYDSENVFSSSTGRENGYNIRCIKN